MKNDNMEEEVNASAFGRGRIENKYTLIGLLYWEARTQVQK